MRWLLVVDCGEILDADDSCHGYYPGDRCGGCCECLLMQAVHAGHKILPVHFVDEREHWQRPTKDEGPAVGAARALQDPGALSKGRAAGEGTEAPRPGSKLPETS